MPNRRLGRRITLAFAFFGLTLTLIFGFGLVVTLKSVESHMIDDTIRAELTYFQKRANTARDYEAFISRTTIIHVLPHNDDNHIPAYLRALAIGTHDVAIDDHNFRVLVEQAGDLRYIVQYDDTDIRRRERQFVKVVWLFSAATLLAALAVGWLLSRRVSAPLTRLAQDVMRLEREPQHNIDVDSFDVDEIGFLAKRLYHYHNQLGQLLAREREFAGNVSHELRTPVTNISLAAEVLASNPDLSEKERVRINRIQRAAREMSELVDTFLVLAKAQGPDKEYHSACDVNAIVRDVVDQQNMWLRDKPIDVVIEDNTPLKVNAPIRVVAVLVANLIRNAFRYTERGRVEITLEDNRLTVKDTGPGIDAETQARLFEPRVQGTASDPDGAGLGLAIVNRICERYGWRVNFDSAADRGTRFEVTF